MTKSIQKAIKGDVFIKGNRGDKVGSWENADNVLIDGVKLIDILLDVRQLKEDRKAQAKIIEKQSKKISEHKEHIKELQKEVKKVRQELVNTVKGLLTR